MCGKGAVAALDPARRVVLRSQWLQSLSPSSVSPRNQPCYTGRRMSKRTVRVVAAVVAVDGRYLITQRRSSAVLPNLWEFPGGRVEADESDAAALRREIHERLGVHIDVGQMISFVSHPYEHYKVDLYLYECRLVSGELRARAVQAFRWITSDEFDNHDFAPADEASMSQLLGEDESRH
jgi:8-oxo-dGTP diphosphatase